MKKLSLVLLLIAFVTNSILAQIPIVYYDFENNASRTTFENATEMSVNTPPGGAAFTYVTSAAGACNTIDCSNANGKAGAGQEHGGSVDGSGLTVGAWNQATADPGTGATSYYQFVVNTSGFNGISLIFDTKYGNGNSPDKVGVLISSNGSTWTFVGSTGTPNGNTPPVSPGTNSWSPTMANFNLTAASAIANNNGTLYIRVYAYNASGGGVSAYLSLDNVTILATSTVAGKVFTTLNENNYYTSFTSGLTGATVARNSFTATGAGTNVTINGTSGLKMASGQTFGVASSATVTFGSAGAISGTGGIFNIASGCTAVTSNAGGLVSSITTTGANVYTAGANYTFNASTSTPFPTGTFGNPANVTINPGAGSTVTLNINPTISGVLSLTNGKLALGTRTLTLNGSISGATAANVITGGASSNLSIGGTGALAALYFDQSIDGTTNNIGTFTLNRTSSGTMTMGNKLVTGTACNLTNGNMLLNGQTLVLNGTFSGSASASLRGTTSSVLSIGGAGSLGTLYFDQTTPGTTNAVSAFTLNRASSGIATLGNALSIGTGGLNLTNGSLADGGNIVTLAGNISGTGAHSGSGKITMTGSGATISSVSLGNLELNNAGGFSLTGSPAIGGTLTLSAGKLTIGANNLVFGIAAAISGTPSSSSMIVANSSGQVRKLFSSNGSFLYPIGDNVNYAPITLNFTGGSYAVGAYCAVNVKTTKHPSNVNVSDYLNRYWPVVTSGITSPVYAVTAATYVPGDVSGTEASLSMGQYTGALPWVKFGATNTATHTLSSSATTAVTADFAGITTAAPSVSSSANSTLCVGGSTTLTASAGTGDPSLTYQWAPATGLSATTGTSVTATPASTTTYTLTITDGNGFTGTASTTITVNPPPTISGNTTGLCTGADNTLTGNPTGGTWQSSDGTKATVSATGVVSGLAAGTTTITYTASPGCVITTVVTVLPLPASITGNFSVCTGNTTTLGHPTAGGTWASSDPGNAPINSSGMVSGLLAGTTTITYTVPSGCTITQEVTVQPVPAAITGTTNVCVGLSITLGHPVGGGTWESSNTAVGTINSSGDLSGLAQGSTTITYTVPLGCITTMDVTINPLPAAIGGTAVVCDNATTTLTNADGGGAWNIFPSTTATINSSGVVSGVAAGSATAIYTLPTGCGIAATVTVIAAPAAISGPSAVCLGQTISLSDATPFGTWGSGTTSVATVDAAGIVSGITSGTSDISYTTPNGCSVVNNITVNALPAAITGAMNVCVNSTTTLTDADGGGTWGSADATVGVGTATGIISGLSAGTASVTYTLATGCIATTEMTVNPLPAAITGTSEVCVNSTTTLFDATGGGTWSSAASGTATVNPTTGEVTGVAAGVTDIIYTLSTSCAVARQLTVDPLPASITGNAQVCHGATTVWTNTSTGGTWSSDATSIASIDAGGTLSGVSPGTANITYTLPTGCITTMQVTVNALPAPITGPTTVCDNSAVTLADADGGGTWTSGDVAVSVGAASGVITGVSAGTAAITYTLPTSCAISREITVNVSPVASGGPNAVCEAGSLITVTNTDAGGTWSSTDATVTVGATTGDVTGVFARSATISYTFATGCSSVKAITVNPLPATISGPNTICNGSSATYTTTSPGVSWSSSNIAIITINPGGVANAVNFSATGVDIICTYISTGCSTSLNVTANPLPAAVTGVNPVCEGFSTPLDNAAAGGTWSSSATGIATISAGGILNGVAQGNTTISYILPTGCYRNATATVNPVPAPITGIAAVCHGLTTTLSTMTAGGTWSSSADPIATVDGSGMVSGVTPGTADISYTLSTGCYAIRVATVNELPSAISGETHVCHGLSTTLGSLPAGGTWQSGNTGAATVDASTGLVSGTAPGTADITYTLPTGCIIASNMTVDALPAAVTGTARACVGLSTTLADADAGGTWSSGDVLIADVDALGVVSGISAGNAMITYMLPTGCIATAAYTVDPLPAAFVGAMQICEGLTTILTDALTGGTWTSGDVATADVTPVTGVVSGLVAGTADITYTLPTGCMRAQTATVNAAVPSIAGAAEVCNGLTTTLSNSSVGGVWISENTSVANVGLFTGVVTGVNAGTSKITYALSTGCLNTVIATVNPLPAAITGALNVCAGYTTSLGNVTPGGTWSGGASGIASINTSGVVSGLAAGSAAFTYMLSTGCIKSVDVVVNPLPVAQTISGGGSYCAGGAGVHIGLGNTEPGTTYRLYRGSILTGTQLGTGAAVDFGIYVVVGTYTVKATVNATGCYNTMTGSTSVSVAPHLTPSVLLYSDLGDTVCSGTPVTFTATSVNGGTSPIYEWSVNASTPVASSSFVYSPVHGDTIKVRLTSSEACATPVSVLAKKKMNVIDNHMPTISIEKTSGDTLCMASTAVFRATGSWGGYAPVYTWQRNGTDMGTGIDFSYVPANGDVITCKLTSNFRCRLANTATSNSVTLHIDSTFIPEISINANPGLIIAPLSVATLTATVTKAGSSPVYIWQVNGLTISSATGPVFASSFTNNDVVTCIVYGSGPCGLPSFNSVTIKVQKGAGVAPVVENIGEIRLMPNPTSGAFTVEGNVTGVYKNGVVLEVSNMLGQVVYTAKVETPQGKFTQSVSIDKELANGVYILSVTSGSESKRIPFALSK
jgi:trimeric autotransporter adhesin